MIPGISVGNTVHLKNRILSVSKCSKLCRYIVYWKGSVRKRNTKILSGLCTNVVSPPAVETRLSVICDRSVVFSGSPGFFHQYNWPPRYNWNIVESGVKHHQTNINQRSDFKMFYQSFRKSKQEGSEKLKKKELELKQCWEAL